MLKYRGGSQDRKTLFLLFNMLKLLLPHRQTAYQKQGLSYGSSAELRGLNCIQLFVCTGVEQLGGFDSRRQILESGKLLRKLESKENPHLSISPLQAQIL